MSDIVSFPVFFTACPYAIACVAVVAFGTIGLLENVLIPAIVSFPVSLTAVLSATVIFALPSNETPLIVLAVSSLVAVALFPFILPSIGELNVLIPAYIS